jgi:hypothetical protein
VTSLEPSEAWTHGGTLCKGAQSRS